MNNFKYWLNIQEGLALKGGFKGSWFQRLVAAMYVLAPESEQEAVQLYIAPNGLTNAINHQFNQLQTKYTHHLSKSDPFKSSKELAKHIDDQKKAGIKKPSVPSYDAELGPNITQDQKGHPVWNKDQDQKFGWVHDLLTHYAGKLPFDARGEAKAYLKHLKTLPPHLAPILFTEIIAQTSYYYIYGDFPKQKVTILKDFDHINVGKLNPQSKLNQFFEFKNKELIPKKNIKLEELKSVNPLLPTILKNQESRWHNNDKPKHKLDTLNQN
jgi:hypothetical protein